MEDRFEIVFGETMKHEGGYVHDPDDPGGETYRGISRRHHPNWEGWGILDAMQDSLTRNLSLKLNAMVKDFYRREFWERLRCDEIESLAVAAELFDTAVNMGRTRAPAFLQAALNVMNRNGEIYRDLVEDGRMGRRTLAALRAYLDWDSEGYLLTVMNVLQGYHYISVMRQDPVMEKYARGWLSRVRLGKG